MRMRVTNRKCIRKLALRSILASRKRNLITVIAIILTALLFTSVFTVALSMNKSYQEYTFRRIGGYSHGTFKDVSAEQMAAIFFSSYGKAIRSKNDNRLYRRRRVFKEARRSELHGQKLHNLELCNAFCRTYADRSP